jgi:hypothetical protein
MSMQKDEGLEWFRLIDPEFVYFSWFLLIFPIYTNLSWFLLIFTDLLWFIMIYPYLFWFILIYPDFYWFILIYAGLCWFILIYPDLFWFILIFTDLSWFILIYPDLSWFILIYSDFYWLIMRWGHKEVSQMRHKDEVPKGVTVLSWRCVTEVSQVWNRCVTECHRNVTTSEFHRNVVGNITFYQWLSIPVGIQSDSYIFLSDFQKSNWSLFHSKNLKKSDRSPIGMGGGA